jgi:hypothetical protein
LKTKIERKKRTKNEKKIIEEGGENPNLSE